MAQIKKESKAEIFTRYGVKLENGKIQAPEFGWINPLLINGNAKLGKGVYTFSTLPTNKMFNVEINGKNYEIKGACPCSCAGCYATTGFYNMPSVMAANAIKTYLSRNHVEFVKNAIIAQIKAENIKLVRIHASGDFFDNDYISAWREIVKACPDCVF